MKQEGRENEWPLFTVSMLCLYLEICLIRFVPAEISILGHYPNVMLMACFFGMGTGLLLTHHRRSLFTYGPIFLLSLILITMAVRHITPSGSIPVNTTVVLIIYLATASVFVPFGQRTGLLMDAIAPLRAYTINLLGSTGGVLLFSLLSLLSTPPVVWLAVTLPLIFIIYRREKDWPVLPLVITACAAGLVFFMSSDSLWSPYHSIRTERLRYYTDIKSRQNTLLGFISSRGEHLETLFPGDMGCELHMNNELSQLLIDLSQKRIADYPFLRIWQEQYRFPFTYGSCSHVLILGGGGGNDAAAAITMGAGAIDVVEIDPLVIKMGRENHPEKPYAHSRVTVYCDDARHFLHRTDKTYDLIVFSYVDAWLTQLNLSNIRLDSYVYTLEAFTLARKHLKDHGILAVSYGTIHQWSGDRLRLMLREATGSEPLMYPDSALGYTMLAGRGLDAVTAGRPVITVPENTRMATDDWPFFILKKNSIPPAYLFPLTGIFLFSVIILFLSTPERGKRVDMTFFMLGCAFMLLEMKSIATISLLFGSTWMMSSLVLISFLSMALLGNLLALKMEKVSPLWWYIPLALSLALTFLLPLEYLGALPLFTSVVLAGLLTSLPVLSASLIFSLTFRNSANPGYALGSNILGGVTGGILEYLSMITGQRFLIAAIGLIYLLSAWTLYEGRAVRGKRIFTSRDFFQRR